MNWEHHFVLKTTAKQSGQNLDPCGQRRQTLDGYFFFSFCGKRHTYISHLSILSAVHISLCKQADKRVKAMTFAGLSQTHVDNLVTVQFWPFSLFSADERMNVCFKADVIVQTCSQKMSKCLLVQRLACWMFYLTRTKNNSKTDVSFKGTNCYFKMDQSWTEEPQCRHFFFFFKWLISVVHFRKICAPLSPDRYRVHKHMDQFTYLSTY